ncbi:hypothetical protein JR316_0005225 [Psilocybe cubensis]|uniref:Uncharacterized protein n=2 Tax=Psilocybe cubensis TaxID=181762 RepID=A0ACB8H7G2_PSICU|nr:hypothetical protein JR316_0005225 [Psilocybe cubensis]KAH9483124.1 hypothetical protein JR316_0005225 [Psilocybe cubensis]
MMPPTFNVPQELIELIIDEVACIEDDTQRLSALRSCSRTSWSFLTPCRQYLFAEVTLIEDAGDNRKESLKARLRLQKFLQLLQNDPYLHSEHHQLSSHIKTLKVELSFARAASNKRGFREQNRQCAVLPSILEMMHHVHKFGLYSEPGPVSVSWDLVDDSLKDSLTHFCKLQPIATMELYNISEIPVTLMTDCLGVVSLSARGLTGLTGITEQGPRTHSQSPFSMLENLTVAFSPQFFDFLQSVPFSTLSTSKLPYSSLRRLETSLGRNEWDFIRSVPSLSHLCISRTSETFNRYSYLDFRRLQTLHHLKLKWDFGNTVGLKTLLPVIAWPKPGADPQFEDTTLPQTVPITTLEIFGQWNFCSRKNEQQHFMASAGWNALDTVLSGNMFHNLCFIHFDLSLHYTETPTSPKSVEKYLLNKISAKLSQLLPVLSKSPSTDVQLEIHVVGHDALSRTS